MTRILVLALALLAFAIPAWAQDAGVDCASDKYRCQPDCACPDPVLPEDQPCNDLPNGALAVSYPTAAEDVLVLCPTVYMSGAADPETPNFMFYRVETSLENTFSTLTYDSGLVTAFPGTTEHQIVPNGLYPTPIVPGTSYWLRVTDNDDCSITGGPYYANPTPWISLFTVADDVTDNCLGGDADADADADVDADSDADGNGGGGSSGCSVGGPAPSLAALPLLALATLFLRRRK